jgi:hypothetical protein
VSFAFDVRVLVPDYEVDGILFLKHHYEGGFIYRNLILVEAWPSADSPADWKVKYSLQDGTLTEPDQTVAKTRALDGEPGLAFDIPILQPTTPGLKGTIRIEVRPWT